jgi:HD-GYP domain-containing protein (c-di-GMP phosphodiesterase class II)
MLRLRRASALIGVLVAGQILLLAGGFATLAQWLERDVRALVREQVLATNQQIAVQMSHAIEQMELATAEVGTRDWQQLQTFIEQIELPNEGFLCIASSKDGRMLCHPDFENDPAVRAQAPGQATLHSADGGEPGPIIDRVTQGQLASGWLAMPDGRHMVAARDMPSLGVKVMAHQRQAGIDAAVAPIVQRIWTIGGVVTFLLALGSGGVTTFVVRRYENRLARANVELEQRVEQRTHQLTETRDAVIFGLAKLAESRDDETGEHLERIGYYVETLARQLATRYPELDECRIHRLKLAASLHDIGKVGVPDRVLLKAGALDEQERAIIEKHPVVGGVTLFAIRQRLEAPDDFLIPACEIAFAHHERWDGTGYPFGLSGEQIPLAARIVALADVYDALTTDRVYRGALSHEQARQIILEGEGSHFDPTVAAAFRETEAAFRHGASEFNASISPTAQSRHAQINR